VVDRRIDGRLDLGDQLFVDETPRRMRRGGSEEHMSAFDAEYEPSPWEPIAEEVDRYERTGGAEPSGLVGDQWIVLWTLGSKSGKVRKTPLVRVADGEGRYAVVGSQGGAPTDPHWVHNLRAHPVARLQDGTEVHDYRVREASGDEKATWWERAVAVWPDYDGYQAATDRSIPLFVLEPAG
jgi:deazaflavin-dependent oxidoreductase (nitroreductase family)